MMARSPLQMIQCASELSLSASKKMITKMPSVKNFNVKSKKEIMIMEEEAIIDDLEQARGR